MNSLSVSIQPPDHLYIEITNACNFSCKHCYMEAGPTGKSFLDPGVIKRALTEFASMGGRSVALSGGEPLLHPSWKELAKYARSAGLLVMVISNGALLDPPTIKWLFDNEVTLALSLEGIQPSTHDAIRGKSSYSKAKKALDLVAEFGMQKEVVIGYTPTKQNLGDLSTLVFSLCEQDFRRVYISLLEERGRQKAHAKELSLSVLDKVNLLTQLSLLLSNAGPRMDIDASHLRYFFERLYGGWDGVGDPIEGTLRISPLGQVYLTAYIEDDHFILGNLYKDGLRKSVQTSTYDDWMNLSIRRMEGIQACQDCPYWIVCGGGSPIRAYATHHDLMQPDDFCEAKQIFLDKWYQAVE